MAVVTDGGDQRSHRYFPWLVLNAQWTMVLGSVTVAGNQCVVPWVTTFTEVYTVGTYDCTNGSLWCQLLCRAWYMAQAEFGIFLADSQDDSTSNGVGIEVKEGTLGLTTTVAGGQRLTVRLRMTRSTISWLRLRFSGTTIYGHHPMV